MSTRTRNPDPYDPLASYSDITLLPRTLASMQLATSPFNLRSSQDFFKSMPLQSTDNLLEQAKAIMESCPVASNTMVLNSINSKLENETVTAKDTENPQERRPALGRKRARFSMKPNLSQPTVDLEPLDLDKLKDPEEFFLAFEKHENATRELHKQTGVVSMDLNKQNTSLAARPRRPGLLGRSVKYKHHYSSEISSQDNHEENISNTADPGVQIEIDNKKAAFEEAVLCDELQEVNEVTVTEAENRVNKLLGELLADHSEELDRDGTVNLLQERLQIKPIDIEKLCIPDMQDVRRLDLKASAANLTRPRTVLSNIENVVVGINNRTPKTSKQAVRGVACLASPTPPRSPLSSIISLKKHIQQSISSTNPYLAFNFDQSPGNASPSESFKEENAQGHAQKEGNSTADLNLSVPEVIPDESMDNNLSSASGSKDDYVNDKHEDMDRRVMKETSGSHNTAQGHVQKEGNSTADLNLSVPEVIPDESMDNNLSSASESKDDHVNDKHEDMDRGIMKETSGTDKSTNELNEFDEKMEDTLEGVEDSVASGPNMNASNEPIRLDDKMGDTLKAVESAQHLEKLNPLPLLDEANPPLVEEPIVVAPSVIEDGPTQHNEETHVSSKGPINKETKTTEPHNKRKRKEASRRQSLAAFGTSWEGGTRRSTRIKSRPLEYWKGERFLYGRINQSVVSVIGIKYESPGKKVDDGTRELKVKSFVPDTYKDQLEDAARF